MVIGRGSRNDFPSVFFLDSDAFSRRRVAVPHPGTGIPPEVQDLVGIRSQLQQGQVEIYFNSVHLFFPIGLETISRN